MKATSTKLILIGLAILMTFGLVAWVRYDMKTAQADIEKILTKENAFGTDNITWIKTDTFINLVNKAYHPNVETTFGNNLLIVQIKNANAVTADFYNGNEALLKHSINDHDFEINFDKHNNNVVGRFKTTNNLVAIPNDVLIKIIGKNVN